MVCISTRFQIIILKNGAIAAAGDFERLSASGLDIATMIAREATEDEKPPADAAIPAESTADDTSIHSSFRKRQLSIHSVSRFFHSKTAPRN